MGYSIMGGGGGGGANPNIYTFREYTSSDTWSKPSGLKEAVIVCIGGGGGAGSGAKGDSSGRTGGAGASGAAIVISQIKATDLGSSETITIGAGGAGGASQTTSSSNGNAGVDGGDTSFGTHVIAKGGNGGVGGIQNSGTWASTGDTNANTDSTPAQKPYNIVGSKGMLSYAQANGVDATSSSMGEFGCGGGGGGGCIASNGSTRTPGKGSRVYDKDGTLSTATAYNTNGAANIALQIFERIYTDLTTYPTIGVGASGGGGERGSGADGQTGGAGGNYGGGGAGGGACTNTYNSGAGGAGGAGCCIVLEVT